MSEYYIYPYFKKEELNCECGCGIEPSAKFLSMLKKARENYGRAVIITGKLRCREEQMKINPDVLVTDHEGWGIDVRRPADGRGLWKLFMALIGAGFTRIGIYNEHVHFGAHPDLPPEVIWTGKSK